jgi:hypothetical protein
MDLLDRYAGVDQDLGGVLTEFRAWLDRNGPGGKSFRDLCNRAADKLLGILPHSVESRMRLGVTASISLVRFGEDETPTWYRVYLHVDGVDDVSEIGTCFCDPLWFGDIVMRLGFYEAARESHDEDDVCDEDNVVWYR